MIHWLWIIPAFLVGIITGAFWGGWLMMGHYLKRNGETMIRLKGGSMQQEVDIEYELMKHSNAN